MITIDRQALLQKLIVFCQTGSGLIVGNPGVGKSHLLRQLKNALLNEGTVSFIIRVDNLNDATDASIQEALDVDTPWIETFGRIKLNGEKKALLIFDTFDAARNDHFRKAILKQIQRAKEVLADKWNVLVSVRAYDASKSQQLIQLFPKEEGFTDLVNARKFIVDPLTEEQVINSISGTNKFESFYKGAGQPLREILRIPFFLILADTIIQQSNHTGIEEVKQFRSETQLLERFWNIKVNGDNEQPMKEKMLSRLTDALVTARSLSIPKQTFLEKVTKDDAVAIELLRRDEIIEYVSVGGSRVAFGHNIYFDYAVSVLLLSSEIVKLIAFIKIDTTRPFFLRPSFIYFFTQLWYDERPLFWKFYWELSNQETKEIDLFVRSILTGVVASEFTVEDITPILESTNEGKINFIRNLLQSIRFIRAEASRQDVLLIELLSKQPNILYIWEIGFLLDQAVNAKNYFNDLTSHYGQSARNLLLHVLEGRKGANKQFLDRIGAMRGVELVCKTFGSDAIASRNLLQRLFELFKEHDFEISYFSNLAEYINYILPWDPEFVGEIFKELFHQEETSNAETTMGNSVLMNLRSTRMQDYSMVYYRLFQKFPEFLTHSPKIAIPIGLELANKYAKRGRMSFFEADPQEVEYFKFKSFDCKYVQDNAAIWSEHSSNRNTLQMVVAITDRFKTLHTTNGFQILKSELDLFVQNAKIGSVWKSLVKFGIESIPHLKDYFFDFCVEQQFYRTTDLSYELRELIEKGSPYFTNAQIKQIEEAVFQAMLDTEKDQTGRFAQRYLSRIPTDRLQLQASKELLQAKGTTPNEKPVTSSFSSSIYSTEEWLQDQGIDTSAPMINDLLQRENNLRPFTSKWLNNKPSREDYEHYLPIAAETYILLKEHHQTLPEEVFNSVLREVVQTFSSVTRDEQNLKSDEIKIAKEVISYCYQYRSSIDKQQDEKISSSGSHSPTPRISATEGLGNLANIDASEEILDLLADALTDPNAIVRLYASRSLLVFEERRPELYERIITERLPIEQDAGVASNILSNVRIEATDVDRANRILDLAYSNAHLFSWQNVFMDDFIMLAFKLWVHRQNARADQILSGASERKVFEHNVIFKGFKEFPIVSADERGYSERYLESVVKWTTIYLTNAVDKLNEKLTTETQNDPEVKSAFELLDLIVQRIYFALEGSGKYDQYSYRASNQDRKRIYDHVKPIFEKIVLSSSEITEGGFIIAHTAHYLIQTLNACLDFDAKQILKMVYQVTELSYRGNYTFDPSAIREVVKLTERLLTDYRELLADSDSFNYLISLLDIYTKSGWPEALELLWKLDEIFK